MQKALLIFIKNPALGKVKTRLAKTVGDVNALKIYQFLLEHTMEITYELDTADKFIYYNEFVPTKDEWPPSIYQKELQKGANLGEKYLNAFTKVFDEAYQKAVIISPDCPKLSDTLLEKAFKMLDNFDVVLGPTEDGNYYLIGMKKLHADLFDIDYESGHRYEEVMKKVESLGLRAFKLPTLLDVDMEEDLGKLKRMIKVDEKPSRRKKTDTPPAE